MYRFCIILILSILSLNIFAQKEKKFVRKGNRQYADSVYSEAEINYRKALEQQSNSPVAYYNLGNSLYRQKKFEEAIQEYGYAAEGGFDKKNLAKAYHNIGNSYLQSQKYQESIEAYKKALRNNPTDIETKYNLAFAQKMLKNPPKQNQNNQQNQQDKNNQDQQNKDKKDQNKDNNKQDQQQNQQQNQQQQNQPGKISRDDAKRMLEAIQNDENNTQDKLKKEKVDAKKVRPDVDW